MYVNQSLSGLGDWTDSLIDIAKLGIQYEVQTKQMDKQIEAQKQMQEQAQRDALARMDAQAKADAQRILAERAGQTGGAISSAISGVPSWVLPTVIAGGLALLAAKFILK